MYLGVKHMVRYMEISMFLAANHMVRYMEISMYPAAKHMAKYMEKCKKWCENRANLVSNVENR